jgi:hypothetical protein
MASCFSRGAGSIPDASEDAMTIQSISAVALATHDMARAAPS